MPRGGVGLLLAVVVVALVALACGGGEAAPGGTAPVLTERPPSGTVATTPLAAARSATPTPTATARPPASKGLPPPELSAAAAIVYDDTTGSVLYERDAHRRLPPASLTKIATAAVVIEAGHLDRVLTANPDRDQELRDDVVTMGLEPGDQFSERELLYGLLLVSGADAAEALVDATAGSLPAFVDRMNALVARLGLHDTHFTDATGLGGPDHYSSASDLVLLAKYAMSLPDFRTIVGTEAHTATGSREIPLENGNPLLGYTPGVDGVKTGYTEQAGRTFVVSVNRDGHRIYVALLNVPTRAQDAIALIDWTYANFTWP